MRRLGEISITNSYVDSRTFNRKGESKKSMTSGNAQTMDKMGVLSEGPAKSLLAICTTDGFGLEERIRLGIF